MMKKAIKKLLAALLAVAMVCAMAIPAFAYDTKEDLNTKHEYDAFQIFNGDVTGNDTDGFKISNVTWGKNIPHPEDFLEKLTEDSTIGGEFKTDFTPQEAVAVISKWHDSDNNSIAFARFAYGYLDFRSFRGLESVYYVIPCTVFTIVITAFLIKSKAGRNFVAIREDEMAAVTVGIDVFKYKMAAMGYSSALCGLAGGLLAHYMTNVNPAMFTSAKSNELLIAVVLGGRGSLTGVILAAAILTPLPELLRFGSAQEWRLIIYGFAIVFVILFRPKGLMGDKELSLSAIVNWFERVTKRASEVNMK